MTLQEIGERLRQRREELGLSLRDAQTATKIRWRYLEALEQGDDSVMPGYVYAKGFLRAYAEYLGLDGWELVEAYKQVHEGQAAEATRRERRSRPPRARPSRERGPSRRVGGPALTLPPRRLPAGRRRSGSFFTLMILIVMLAAALIGGYYLYLAAQEPPGREDPETGAGNGAPPETAPVTAPPGDAEPAPEEPEPPPPAPGVTIERAGTTITYRVAAERLRIDVAVTARCWVRVEADGALVTETTLQPGQQVTWEAGETLRVRAGYPAGLRLSIAGEPLELDAADAVTLVFLLDT